MMLTNNASIILNYINATVINKQKLPYMIIIILWECIIYLTMGDHIL